MSSCGGTRDYLDDSQPTSIRMHDKSVRVEFGRIDGLYPDSLGELDQLLINYVSFRQATYMSYRTTNNHDINALPEAMAKSAHHVLHELPTNILQTRDDYPSIMELATRWLSSYLLIPSLLNRLQRMDRLRRAAESRLGARKVDIPHIRRAEHTAPY